MKFVALGVSLFLFVVLPYLLLETFIMPELHQMTAFYSHQDATANQLFPQP